MAFRYENGSNEKLKPKLRFLIKLFFNSKVSPTFEDLKFYKRYHSGAQPTLIVSQKVWNYIYANVSMHMVLEALWKEETSNWRNNSKLVSTWAYFNKRSQKLSADQLRFWWFNAIQSRRGSIATLNVTLVMLTMGTSVNWFRGFVVSMPNWLLWFRDRKIFFGGNHAQIRLFRTFLRGKVHLLTKFEPTLSITHDYDLLDESTGMVFVTELTDRKLELQWITLRTRFKNEYDFRGQFIGETFRAAHF